MSTKFTVAIVCETPGSRPLSLVRIEDRMLLQQVATRALRQVDQTQATLAQNGILAQAQRDETNELRRILEGLLLDMPSQTVIGDAAPVM